MKRMDHISIEDISKLSEDQVAGLFKFFEISGYYVDFNPGVIYPSAGYIWASTRSIHFTHHNHDCPVLPFNEVVEMAMMGMLV